MRRANVFVLGLDEENLQTLLGLAEEALSGALAAVEGFSYQGEVVIYGALDSLNYPGTTSFLRHQYPSQLPEDTRRHMADVARRVISHIGLDSTTFSIEFFCDAASGDVALLEINARHSQSHAELFDWVDGVPNHHLMLRLALGERPTMPRGESEYAVAAKWYHRRFYGDGVLRRGPTQAEIEAIQRNIPGVIIHIRWSGKASGCPTCPRRIRTATSSRRCSWRQATSRRWRRSTTVPSGS